jgi:hypothetical protein
MRHAARIGLLLVVGLFLVPASSAQERARERLRAGRGADRVRLDGRLDEPEWAAADSIADLVQVEPTEGGTPSGRTVVRVLAGPDGLVIGVWSGRSATAQLASFARERDADLEEEDHVRIVLDTYRDERSGFLFMVNPHGARYDALVTNQGESENDNWDAAWEAATAERDGEWTAEIRIPIRSLAFRRGLESWGFNIERRIQANLETARWAGARRDQMFGQTGNAGLLVDLPAFNVGAGLTVRPSLTAGGGYPAKGADLDGTVDPSLDVQKRLGPDLRGSVTLNTDFAETEVDTRQTNLTRFPLFFPEKRTFFLENSDLFEFGLGLGTEVVPFFSRRVGLLESREVPIRVGAKLDGQVGGTRIGALLTRTGREAGLAPGTTLGALRVRQNVLRESSLGAMATWGDPTGAGTAWLGGADFTYRTSRLLGDKNFLVGVWGAVADRAGAAGDRTAVGVKVDYPNDRWDVAVTWKRIGDGFDPALGFVPRRGVHRLSAGGAFMPRPAGWGVRQMFFEGRLTLVTNLDGRWESFHWSVVPLNWLFESGDQIEVSLAPQGERLVEPFEVADGVEIGPRAYRFTRFEVDLELASHRRLSGQATWSFGGFYTGHLHQLEASARWKPSATLSLALEAEHAIGRLPEGNFTESVAGARVRVNLSPDLQINSFIQYDTESRLLGANSRLRWIIGPTAELFVVYNHNVRDRLDRWEFSSNQLLAKLQYALQY